MQEILVDSTDALHLDLPPEVVGLVAAVDVRVQTPSTALPSAYGSAGSEGVAWTVTSAARGLETLTRATSTGTAQPTPGVSYVVVPSGERTLAPLVVEVQSLASGSTSVGLREPLPRDVATGETLVSRRYLRPLSADETSSPGFGLGIWRVTTTVPVNGRTEHTYEVAFQVSRRLTLSPYTLSASELTRTFPAMHRFKPSTDGGFDEAIRAAWEQYVRPALEDRQLETTRIKSWDRINPVLAAATFYHVLSMREDADPDFVSSKWDHFERQRDSLLHSLKFWYDSADDRKPLENDPERPYGGGARRVR